jgi:hypothetical protein
MRVALAFAVVLVVAGCDGGSRSEHAEAGKVTTPGSHLAASQKCTHVSRGFRACTRFFEQRDEQSAIYRRDGDQWTKVRGGLPGRHGWWRRVIAPSDRRTLLGEWSGECESPSTYFVSAADGNVRPIFQGHNSTAAGWTHPGPARVRLSEEIWRGPTKLRDPGMYLVDPRTLSVIPQGEKPARPGC